MGAFIAELAAAHASLTQWVNLAALAAGLVAGCFLSSLAQRAGIERPGVLALIFPVLALLEPATALIALAAAVSSAMIFATTNVSAARDTGVILAIAIALLVLVGLGAPLFPKFNDAEKFALLLAAAAVSVIAAAWQTSSNWLPALLLTTLGIGAAWLPWQLLDATRTSPHAPLLALLLVGPAVAVLAPTDRLRANATPTASLETAFGLPAFLALGVPITSTMAIFMLLLSEFGLSSNAQLLSRPKWVLAFFMSLAIAGGLAYCMSSAVRMLGVSTALARLGDTKLARLAALSLLVLSAFVLWKTGLEPNQVIPALVSGVLGAALVWFGWSPAWLLCALMIGQMLAKAAPAAQKIGFSGPRALVCLGAATLAMSVAAAWPWINRLRRSTTGA